MELLDFAQNLEAEIKNIGSLETQAVALSKNPRFPKLLGVLTDAYDLDSEFLSPQLPVVTIVYGPKSQIVEVFGVAQDRLNNSAVLRDTKGNEVVLNGAIDSEQFLFVIEKLFGDQQLERITVVRHSLSPFLDKMRSVDALFVKAALKSYSIGDHQQETDRLVVEVLESFDGRPFNDSIVSTCQGTGWCMRWKWGHRCIKSWGICDGILP